MKLRISIIVLGLLVGYGLQGWYDAANVSASDDCPVTSVGQKNADGSTTVVFDCGSRILTIREPVWP